MLVKQRWRLAQRSCLVRRLALHHLVKHQTHHRGQLTTLLRQLGHVVAVTVSAV
ncbi:DinB family protein [Alishewanella longhuensis]|uniref:DinB family protein n=1 Tax=Alishewanella longhuensis TaxID=1091037 RepID=UPI001E452008|nr:DinB family protein [Alishewanella longhuensis]